MTPSRCNLDNLGSPREVNISFGRQVKFVDMRKNNIWKRFSNLFSMGTK